MRLFYIIALVMVVLMVASPYYLIPDTVGSGEIVLRYEADGRPVFVENPIVTRGISFSAIRTIDSAVCGDTASGGLLGQVYEGLLSYKYLEFDGTVPQVQPCLAESMPTVSADQLTYTFKIKKGLKFHRNPCFGKWKTFDDITAIDASGKKGSMTVYKTREVTAEDFVLALKRQADPYNNCTLVWPFIEGRIVGLDAWRTKARTQYERGDFTRYDEAIEGIKAIDRHTLEITLIKPYPQFVYLFAIPNLAPTAREAVDYWLAGLRGNPKGAIAVSNRDVEFTTAQSTVGTGPYILKTFKRKDRFVLVRNPDYRVDLYPTKADERFAKEGFLKDAGKAMPFIDKMVSVYTQQELPAWMLFLKGQRDASGIPREAFKSIVTLSKELTDKWKKKGIGLAKVWDPGNFCLYFNMNDKIVGASKSLRRAMCLCYNAEGYVRILMNDRGRRAQTAVPGEFKSARNVIARVEELKKKDKFFNYYNLELAKKTLVLAKEELRAKGLLVDGEIPEIEINIDQGDNDATEYIKAQFDALGLKVKMVTIDFPTRQSKSQRGNYQVITGGWHADYYDAENFLQLYYGPNTKNGMNSARYINPEFDTLYESIREMADCPERTKIYERMIEILCDDCPMIMTIERQSLVLYYDHYKNYHLMPLGTGYVKYRRIDPVLQAERQGTK